MRGSKAFLALAALLPLAGCMGAWGPECPPPAAMPELRYLKLGGAYLETDPTEAWDTLLLTLDNSTTDQTVMEAVGAQDWPAAVWNLSVDALTGSVFSVVSAQPDGADPRLLAVVSSRVETERCQSSAGSLLTWELGDPTEGDSASPGQGLHVYTAGFWENGTLFYTNIEEINDQDWPRAGWYAWEGGDPLPVYVYDQDRSEQPAMWKAPSSQVPPTGSPADPTVSGTLGAVEGAFGLGYFTTIQGFNEALKGLSTTTTRVVRLAPEEAYTLPGYEEHPLYGDPIVFFIKVVDVVDVPCPQGWETDPCMPMMAGQPQSSAL